MRKIADGIVERRLWIVSAVLLAAVVCAVLIFKVGIVTDMAEYLPDDSKMKIGTDLMNEEFPDSANYSIRVMFGGLSDEEKSAMAKRLAAIDNVATVDYVKGDADYNKDDYTKYILRTKYDYESDEEKAIEAKRKQMLAAAKATDFEMAAFLRDEMLEMQNRLQAISSN